MGRTVKLDMPPDQQKFSRLIDIAKGRRTLRQFSEDAGVNYAYLSKITGVNNKTRVTPFFIEKLAAVAENGITYEQLLSCAGYDPSRHPAKFSPGINTSGFSADYVKGFMAGVYYSRNTVFDVINRKDSTTDDIISSLCVLNSAGLVNHDSAGSSDIRPGFVMKSSDGNEYIVLSVINDVCIAILPGGKIKSIEKDRLSYTGHYINEDRLDKLVSVM